MSVFLGVVLRALVVEPNPARSRMYAELLREKGLEVFVVPDGQQACGYLESGARICLLLIELSLPRIDGFAVLRRLQRTHNAGMPVLVASAFRTMRATALELREELGISAILPQATPVAELRDVVERILEGEEGIVGAENVTPEHAEQAEERRLTSLERAGATERDPVTDAELNAIVQRVAAQFEVPVALISIVLRDRQWFRARLGVELADTPLDHSFCRHVVAAKEALIVPDAHVHPAFSREALVEDGTIRGYAGVPLIGSDGEAWGALCVIDPLKPMVLGPRDLAKLAMVASEVVAQIEARVFWSNPSAAPESGFRLRS